MTDEQLSAFDRATRRDVGADFTTRVFARLGLDRFALAASPLGDVFVAWTTHGISGLRFAADGEAFETWYAERFGRRVVRALEDDPTIEGARAALRGEPAGVPLDLRGCSAFEAAVLRKAAEIPRGDARPYGWVARELAAPGASRAVGTALGRNPVPIFIPCHRVIRTDGNPGDYVFGRAAKQHLLESEGVDLAAVARVTQLGYRYIGCEDGYFCMPTCGTVAAKLGLAGHVGLHSAAEAHAHGYKPCQTCRPVAA